MRFLRDNKLIALGTAAGVLLTAVSLVGGGIAYAVHLRDDATASRAIDMDHEQRLRVIETRVTHIDDAVTTLRGELGEVHAEVSGIRHYLDRQPAGHDERQTAATETREKP